MVGSYKIKRLAESIGTSKNLLIITGAGISASAGIPTFRSENALWKNEEAFKLSYSDAWLDDPWRCWFAYEKFRLFVNSKNPTSAHLRIKELSSYTKTSIITTNVDSLHSRAGSNAIEIHGALANLKCMYCGKVDTLKFDNGSPHPGCSECKNWRRHDVVLWDENVKNYEEYQNLINEADCILLIGMSGVVTDTKEIAKKTKSGTKVFEINPTWITPATRHVTESIRMNSDDALEELFKFLH